ncbi:hypothetical protein D3C77_332730 [compost metagenome]
MIRVAHQGDRPGGRIDAKQRRVRPRLQAVTGAAARHIAAVCAGDGVDQLPGTAVFIDGAGGRP